MRFPNKTILFSLAHWAAMRTFLLIITLSFFSASLVEAHRSGCHRWHSCPSDSGSYTCGDTGHCSGCSDNQYCESGRPRTDEVNSQAPISSFNQRYNRKEWPHWVDTDGDCQNTRAEILIRDSNTPVLFKSEKNCRVISGEWIGPYTGETFNFANEIDIDHIVPLKHAYETGGSTWTRKQKREFANDFDNLLATDKSANRSKGHKGPEEWMPLDQSYWCEYGQRWRGIKDKYGLIIRDLEKQSLNRMEQHCE